MQGNPGVGSMPMNGNHNPANNMMNGNYGYRGNMNLNGINGINNNMNNMNMMGPNYTNIVSPIETPHNMMQMNGNPNMNGMMYQMNPNQQQAIMMNHMMPVETPVALTPKGPSVNNRRKSPIMQRAGLNFINNGVGGNGHNIPPPNNGVQHPPQGQNHQRQNDNFRGNNKSPLAEKDYKAMTAPQLIKIIKDKDNKIMDLVDTVEILELKIKKLEQLINLKDARKDMQNNY